MKEAEWLTCSDPGMMLNHIRANRTRGDHRRLRLFGCACVRQVWDLLEDERSRQAVESTEQFVDGKIIRKEIQAFRKAADEASRISSCRQGAAQAARKLLKRSTLWAVIGTASYAGWELWRHGQPDWETARRAAERRQASLLADIFGNPFCPVHLDPAWLAWSEDAVRKLAQAIYDERAFDRLAELADALEDAGCTDSDLLAHCRGPGEHVRGCWVVDLLLGKS